MKMLLHTVKDPYFNMAFDSYVLENTDFNGFYLWQDFPSVIVGLNQNIYAEVNLPYLKEKSILPVRRVSGGGAVYHDAGNLNYSFTGPSGFAEQGPSIIADALARMGVPAKLSGRNDIMIEGRKCSGYAKRLAGGRVMVHGTLMFDVDIDTLTKSLAVPGSKLSQGGVESVRSRVANLKDYLPFSSVEQFKTELGKSLAQESVNIPEKWIEDCERLAAQKFRSWDWIYGRSPKGEFQNSMKFPCGTVTVHYTLCHGVFEEVSFTGDFIGRRPVGELEEKMRGLRREDLHVIDADEWFDGLDSQDFTSLFS